MGWRRSPALREEERRIVCNLVLELRKVHLSTALVICSTSFEVRKIDVSVKIIVLIYKGKFEVPDFVAALANISPQKTTLINRWRLTYLMTEQGSILLNIKVQNNQNLVGYNPTL